MSLIDVRIFHVATRTGGIDGLEIVGKPKVIDEDVWDINLAEVIRTNALAVPADRNLTYSVFLHELQILLSFLKDQAGTPLSLRHDEFGASSGHIKRLVSESLGLGMLTAATERHHRWQLNPNDMANFDVLPAKLAIQYPGVGIRPDLLFDFSSQGHDMQLAGEARGRSSVRPSKPTKAQLKRLNEIVAWSGWNGLHPVTMTYTFTWDFNVQVDLFNIVIPSDSGAKQPDEVGEAGADLTLEFEQPRRRFETPQSIRPVAIDRVSDIADQLYETAPESGTVAEYSVFDRNVRGTWASADLFGASNLRFFLGLLDQPLTPQEAATSRMRMRLLAEPNADPIQVAATQRIIAAISRDRTENPDWSEVANRLEGRA